MTPERDARLAHLRGGLAEALADPRRRQLAHIAVLDIAMAVREALAARGVAESDIARATEEISAFLIGEREGLPEDLADREAVLEVFTMILEAITRQPSFARVFAPQSG